MTKRMCWVRSFGTDETVFCDCTGKESRECKERYEEAKKEQYVDSKGQHSFNDKIKQNESS